MGNAADKSGDNRVDWQEFTGIYRQLRDTHLYDIDELTGLREAFEAMSDERGHVHRKPLIKLLKSMGEPLTGDDYEKAFRDMDTDADGIISWKEFCMWNGIPE